MNIFITAWKNMLRYTRRTIVTASAIAVGILFALFIDALLFGIDQDSKVNLVSYETSAAKIYKKGYFTERKTYPTDILIEAEQRKSIEGFLDKTDIFAHYSPRYVTTCEIIFQKDFFDISGSITAILYGVDPIKEAQVYKTASNIDTGKWLTQSSSNNSLDFNFSDGIVIGSWLAADIDAKIGYYVTIQCKGRGGFIQTIDLPITGIVQTENPIINSTAVYINLAYLNNMLELDGAITEYSINLGNLSTIDSRYTKLAATSSDLPTEIELYPWRDIANDYITLAKAESGISNIMILIICIIAAVGITNTILMAVMERKNEIGMLRTLGYSKGYIKRLFAAEGLCIGFLGTIGGILLSFLPILYMVKTGIDISEMIGQTDIGYRITGIMRSAWHFNAYIFIPIGALIVSALSAWIPSGIVLRQEIATIFRKV